MAASPVCITPLSVSHHRRRPLTLTQRRLEANRRNARSSSGPRTVAGKARVARNAVKHGFFAAQERWSPTQRRDFEETFAGLREEYQPDGAIEEGCVATIAASYVRMAAMLRFENLAALKYHQQQERELNERIAAAAPSQAALLEAERARLRRAGLWKPTIPGPREARAIIRYSGSLDRTIRRAVSELEARRSLRLGGTIRGSKLQTRREASSNRTLRGGRLTSSGMAPIGELQKQTHFRAQLNDPKVQKQTPYSAAPSDGRESGEGPRMPASSTIENAKTNPLSSMFTGNRHERRRAKALARKQRKET